MVRKTKMMSRNGAWLARLGLSEYAGVGARLWRYARPFGSRIAAGLVCGALAGSAQALVARLISRFVDTLKAAENPACAPPGTAGLSGVGALAMVCASVVGLYAVLGILKYAQSVLLATVAQKVGLALRRDVYAHLQAQSLAFFHRRKTGALLSTLTSDVGRLQSAATMLKDLITAPVTALILLGFMFNASPQLTLFSLIAVPVMAVAIGRMTRRLRSLSRQGQEQIADVSATMEETLSAPRVVQAFTAEGREVARMERENRAAVGTQLKGMRRSARLGPVVDFIGSIGVALVLFVGGKQVVDGYMTAGSLVSYFYLLSQLANTASAVSNLKGATEEMMGAADRIFGDVLGTVPDIRDAPNAQTLPPIQGRVEFQNVGFEYEPGRPILQNLSLTIEAGQVVALVGENGAGKSTIADLVPRFHDVTSGAVLVDGYDVRSVTVRSLRGQMAMVPQEVILFGGTIRENIAYGRPDATDTEIEAAAQAANAHDFIMRSANGYETRVGQRGQTLSGGQKQRIAIARAILADPRILILDEATSALDAQTEILLQQALDKLMQNRTTIVIAHRLSTIVHADKIVVLRRGGIIAETGTHAELLARGGVYARLYEAQKYADPSPGAEPLAPAPLLSV